MLKEIFNLLLNELFERIKDTLLYRKLDKNQINYQFMDTNLEKYKKDLDSLILRGHKLYYGLLNEIKEVDKLECDPELKDLMKKCYFKKDYESWYVESICLIKQLIPDRLNDFISLYKNDKRKNFSYSTYVVSDYLTGTVLRDSIYGKVKVGLDSVFPKFEQQLNIVESLKQRFESSLFDIKQLVQADLFDNEINSAKELCKKGFYRSAGVICGVIIEKHFGEVCKNHNIKISKKSPTIADFNDLMKEKNIIEVSTWRFIQRLGDLRNICGHNKGREPTKEEVEELISETDKVLKTIY